MFDAIKGLSGLAAASAAMITIFTLVALVVRGLHYAMAIPARVRAYFFRPKYILIPTPEELAKYCEKSFDNRKPNRREIMEEMDYSYIKYRNGVLKTTKSRIAILIFAFSFLFFACFVRLIYFGNLPGNGYINPLAPTVAGAVSTIPILMLAYLLHRLCLLVRSPTAEGDQTRAFLRYLTVHILRQF